MCRSAAAGLALVMGSGGVAAAVEGPAEGASPEVRHRAHAAVSSATGMRAGIDRGGSSDEVQGGPEAGGGRVPEGASEQPPADAQGDSAQTGPEPATDEESVGVVLIETELGYESSAAAGTGIVLDSDGHVLTNNHVIAGSTSTTVTVATTGETFDATVVGSDSNSDIAVLRLESATGVQTADVDDDGEPAIGDAVTAVGNSGGSGALRAADGAVTALDTSITTTAEGSGETASLEGLIEVDADIVSGDSGGALLDDEGEVVGMNTAASTGSRDITGYAVPIDNALAVAGDMIEGVQTETNTLGYPAFLGVSVESVPASSSQARTSNGAYGAQAHRRSSALARDAGSGGEGSGSDGAVITGVYAGTPAAEAGLEAGDTVTAVGGTAVTNGEQLAEALDGLAPGDRVELSWTDDSAESRTATITLAEGPAD